MNSNNYIFKAIDAYPYELAETVESLDYALAYEPENTEALYLMACLHMYDLEDYSTAIDYCEQIMAIDPYMIKVYSLFINVLTCAEEFQKAQKVLAFAFTVKGSNHGLLRIMQGRLMERQGLLKPAIAAHKEALKSCTDRFLTCFAQSELDRVKAKRRLVFKKSKKTEKAKKKKSKKKKKK
ncbi:hypothetical protein BST97_05225 [Nonlabens spongiae]|uniref:Uncharacterized protein n=1 Tax=Nonlabens spongiae TaxID=331648 RepID=A0A1W6MIL1_9FLAO|nr:hypothetical protein [Nonlabens spongiae]ARN77433.1 hypothetical protein BST97_05225 [Nonlabens spongiae]